MQPIDMKLKYSLITEKEHEIIQYCAKYSDTFSVVSKIKKPYTKIPHIYLHMEVLTPLEPYLVQQVVGAREWPGTSASADNHRVLNYYQCCKETRAQLKKISNLFLPLEYNLPEDICFYRGGEPFFASVSHEKIAFLLATTQQDVAFFQEYAYTV